MLNSANEYVSSLNTKYSQIYVKRAVNSNNLAASNFVELYNYQISVYLYNLLISCK